MTNSKATHFTIAKTIGQRDTLGQLEPILGTDTFSIRGKADTLGG